MRLETSRKQFSPLWRFCEARASLFMCQESSRKQFSPLWWSCQARGGLFKCRKYREIRFHHCGSSVNLVLAWLSTRRHRKSSFHHCGGPVKLVEAWLCTRRHLESTFHHSESPVVTGYLVSPSHSVYFVSPCKISLYFLYPFYVIEYHIACYTVSMSHYWLTCSKTEECRKFSNKLKYSNNMKGPVEKG